MAMPVVPENGKETLTAERSGGLLGRARLTSIAGLHLPEELEIIASKGFGLIHRRVRGF